MQGNVFASTDGPTQTTLFSVTQGSPQHPNPLLFNADELEIHGSALAHNTANDNDSNRILRAQMRRQREEEDINSDDRDERRLQKLHFNRVASSSLPISSDAENLHTRPIIPLRKPRIRTRTTIPNSIPSSVFPISNRPSSSMPVSASELQQGLGDTRSADLLDFLPAASSPPISPQISSPISSPMLTRKSPSTPSRTSLPPPYSISPPTSPATSPPTIFPLSSSFDPSNERPILSDEFNSSPHTKFEQMQPSPASSIVSLPGLAQLDPSLNTQYADGTYLSESTSINHSLTRTAEQPKRAESTGGYTFSQPAPVLPESPAIATPIVNQTASPPTKVSSDDKSRYIMPMPKSRQSRRLPEQNTVKTPDEVLAQAVVPSPTSTSLNIRLGTTSIANFDELVKPIVQINWGLVISRKCISCRRTK